MLKQARVEDIANNRITRIHGHIVVVTQYYPRFLKKNLIHEYLRTLAPVRELLTEFKEKEAECGDHDLAFSAIDYESKFEISQAGWSELARLTELAKERDVYLVCHCLTSQCCHRELLLLAAHHKWQAAIPKLSHAYETFLARLKNA